MLTPRATTQAALDNLISMLEAGVLSSSHNGKTVTFANAQELRDRIVLLQSLGATGADRVAVIKVRRRYEG